MSAQTLSAGFQERRCLRCRVGKQGWETDCTFWLFVQFRLSHLRVYLKDHTWVAGLIVFIHRTKNPAIAIEKRPQFGKKN